MAIMNLILGDVGTGKTTSLRNLPPSETFIISVSGKMFPVKGFKKKFPILSPDGMTGNFCASNDWAKIKRVINLVDKKRSDIKYLVIDDFQYVMGDEYFNRASEKGFEKYSEIGAHAWEIINACQNARTDLHIILTAHTEVDGLNRTKMKTIGKLFDEKGTPAGRFDHIFHSLIVNDEYKFLTNNDGIYLAKTPMDMFDQKIIDNDMYAVICHYCEHYGDEIVTDNNL